MPVPVIGIDLGTTNSCVSMVIDGVPKVIPNKAGYKVMPSVVAIGSGGKKLIGHAAKRQAITNPKNTIFGAKRLIGRPYDSEAVKAFSIAAPFDIVCGEHGDPRIKMLDRAYTIPEIQSFVLSELKLVAEEFYGQPIQKAVITVPAYFKDAQRHATKDAGVIAGLDVIRIINEPTSAALAYGYGKNIEQRVVVFDFGGGTFDLSILEIRKGVYEVITSNGDTYLGGEDFDNAILDWLIDTFEEETGVNLREDPMAMQRLKEASETAKITLSSVHDTEINLPFISVKENKEALHLKRLLTRKEFEYMTTGLLDRCVEICGQALKDAGLTTSDIDAVLLVGGMTRMPKVQETVDQFFGQAPLKNINPDEVVAIGASIQGAMLVDQEGGKNRSILLDLTPHSLGVQITGGLYKEIIPKDSPIPISKSHIFTTERDYQEYVKISIIQGEDEQTGENSELGEFTLTDIRRAPRGETQIKVFFDVDADGTLTVTAKDLDTEKEQGITVSSYGYLSQREIAGMIEYNQEYMLEREQNEQALKVIYTMKNTLQDIEVMMPEIEKKLLNSSKPNKEDALRKIYALIDEVKNALNNTNADYEKLVKLQLQLDKVHDVIVKSGQD